MGSPARTVACQEVLELVSALSGISVADLLGPSRARVVSRVRSVVMHVLRTETGLSARAVGRVLGRTEATVLDLSRLVARGQRASDLAARVRTELRVRHAGQSLEIVSGWKRRPMPDLAARRHAAGLRQDELVARVGIARETLSRIERGRSARPEIIEQLAAALDGTAPRPNSTQRYFRLGGLKTWRTRASLTQQELAARAGIAHETLSRIESGRPVRWELVESLATALVVMPSMLTGNPADDPGDQLARRCTDCQGFRPIEAFVPIRGTRARYWSNADILAAERERARRNKRLRKVRPSAAKAAHAAAGTGGELPNEPETNLMVVTPSPTPKHHRSSARST